jgi:glycosyltransferase involved in cell wall biosynthesis
MPQSLTQALAMQCPVVASRVGGVPEVVRDGVTGLLVPAHDPQGLAAKISLLLRNPEEGKRMGEAGRKAVERDYSREAMLDKTEQLYAHLWEKHIRRAA